MCNMPYNISLFIISLHATLLDLRYKITPICILAVSTQLCNTIADELTRTADNVVQLYKRLTIDNDSRGAIDRDTMLRGLESSVNETMRTLRLVVAGGENDNDGSSGSASNEATAKFQELLAGQDQGKVVNMMQQYSELLLTMMQQRMGGTQSSHT